MRILFIVPYPAEGPSSRLRVEQFLPYLRKEGIEYKIRPFVFRNFYSVLYSKGNYVKKIIFFLWSFFGRLIDMIRFIRYDVFFIHRETCPIGPPFFEWFAHKCGKRIIFDFDDAVYLSNKSRANNFIEHFKNPGKIPYIIKISNRVIAGNKYLSEYALKFNKNVEIIPTCVDTDTYLNVNGKIGLDGLTIGWIGSATTVEYLNILKDVFVILQKKYPCLEYKIIGGEFKIEGLNCITNKSWRLESEILDLRSIDIGVMPMPDNEWTRGKCGFKALLYMSMQIPCVCSPVGVNKDIIEEGVNGFLAASQGEWIDALSDLIENSDLRQKIGRAGRKTVEEKFSVGLHAPEYMKIIMDCARQ